MDSNSKIIAPPFRDLTETELSGFNIFNGLNFTITPEITSALSGTNIDLTGTTSQVLSAISNYFIESMRTTVQELSVPVIHPWDALKMSLFEPEYEFPTIDNIEVPEEVTHQAIQDKIKEHEKEYRSRIIDCINNRDKYTFVGPFDTVSILSEPSGTNCFAVTQDRFKKYIEAVETIRSIDPETVTEENCFDYIKKISYCLASVLSNKTVN